MSSAQDKRVKRKVELFETDSNEFDFDGAFLTKVGVYKSEPRIPIRVYKDNSGYIVYFKGQTDEEIASGKPYVKGPKIAARDVEFEGYIHELTQSERNRFFETVLRRQSERLRDTSVKKRKIGSPSTSRSTVPIRAPETSRTEPSTKPSNAPMSPQVKTNDDSDEGNPSVEDFDERDEDDLC